MRSSYHVEFHNYESRIDADLNTFITQLSHDECVYELSPEFFVKMPLNTSPPTILPCSHRHNKANHINSSNVYASSMALQHRMSLSNMSLLSLVGDDHHDSCSSWSNSEIPLFETLVNDEPLFIKLSTTKPLPKIPTHEDFPGNIWSEPSRSPPAKPTLPLKRNYGSTNLVTLSSTPRRFLLPHSPVSSRMFQGPQTADADPTPMPKTNPKLKRQASYLAFPPQSSRQHKSWSPPPIWSEQVLPRPRANTTASNFSFSSSHHPSNLSTCTTLSPIPSPSISAYPFEAYPRPPSPTSHVHSHPTLEEFISQQSYFFHEDDEGFSQEKNWFETQRRKWLKLGLPRTFELVEEEEEERSSGSSDRVTPSQVYYAPSNRPGVRSMRKKSTAALRDFFMGKK